MNQLIEVLNERPVIIAVLLSWPLFLFVAKVVTQKVMQRYELKNNK